MVEAFSWEQFPANQAQAAIPPESPQQSQAKETPSLSWGEFKTPSTYQGEPTPLDEEGPLAYLTRNVLSNVARGTEGFVGRFGNVEKLIRHGARKFPETTGILGEAIRTFAGEENWEKLTNPEKTIFPTTEKVREDVTKYLTGEYLEPKTKGEKRVQELSTDIGSLGRGLGGSARNVLVNNLGIPAAANAAKAVVEELGFGEGKGTWTKLAAWTALNLLQNVNGAQFAANLMNQGRNAFGNNVRANTPRYETSIDNVSRRLLHGDPRSALAQQQIAGIRNDIANGQISMRDLMNRYDALNAAKRDRGLFDLSRGDRRAAVRYINEVRDAVRTEIEHLGRVNPEGLQAWQNGVQAFSVIHQSNAITNNARDYLTGPYAKAASAPVATLFGAGLYGASKAPLFAGAGLTAAPALYKTGQVAYRVWNDPTLSRYYWNALNAARQENQGAFVENYLKLDKAYEKKFSEQNTKK